MTGSIVLDNHMKIQDGLVTEVEFIHIWNSDRAHMSMESKEAHDVNELHNDLNYSLEDITLVTEKTIDQNIAETL